MIYKTGAESGPESPWIGRRTRPHGLDLAAPSGRSRGISRRIPRSSVPERAQTRGDINRHGYQSWKPISGGKRETEVRQHKTPRGDSRRLALTGLSRRLVERVEAPRPGLNSHHGFVELGAFVVNSLRQTRSYEFSPWNAVPAAAKTPTTPRKPARDPLRLARYYQSLLDSGKFENRAALARHFGVSRARVTQVMNRLKSTDESPTPEVKAG